MGRKHDLAHRIISPIYIGPEGRIVFIQMTFKTFKCHLYITIPKKIIMVNLKVKFEDALSVPGLMTNLLSN